MAVADSELGQRSAGFRFDARACVRAVALGLLAGGALSSPLWIGPRTFPRAPLLELAGSTAVAAEQVLAVVLATSAFALLVAPRARAAAAFACIALGALWALDQTRLQPWAYLYGFVLLRAALARRDTVAADRDLLAYVRLLLACTYFWSGLQKLHAQFGTGGLTELVAPLWPGFAELPPSARVTLGIAIAAAESAIGVALLFERTRRTAALAAIGMHALLVLVLAFGLRWNAVVWPWNAVMIALALAVRGADARERPAGVLWGRDLVHRAQLVLLGLLPALSFVDRWDAYPSLALYSPRIDGARICLGEGVKGRLAPQLQALLVERAPHSYELWLEDWAQRELGTPAYPSERVLRVVARRFLESVGMPAQARVVVHERPGPFFGASEQRVYEPSQL